jgi:hypothetical protein
MTNPMHGVGHPGQGWATGIHNSGKQLITAAQAVSMIEAA